MGQRLDLHALLSAIPGVTKAYFQPPASLSMEYPCIVYSRDYADVKHADNVAYHRAKRYQVTVIDRNPDSGIPDKVAELPMTMFNRHFTADNLHHDIFQLYF